MDDFIKNLESSLDNQKVNLPIADVIRPILQIGVANSYLLKEILTRLIELEQKQELGTADPDKAWHEACKIHADSIDSAEKAVSALLAKIALSQNQST